MRTVQFAESLTADFEENTWTFEMPEDFRVTAGKFAIVPIEQYDPMVKLMRRVSSGMPIEIKSREEQDLYNELNQVNKLSTD